MAINITPFYIHRWYVGRVCYGIVGSIIKYVMEFIDLSILINYVLSLLPNNP